MSKTILITGSSTGIGRATASKFQSEGWNVIATMRTPEKEEDLTKLNNVLVTKLDVQDLSSINNAITEGIAKFGHIDVVLNNAGYGLMGTFESASRESVARQFDVNVFGLFDVTRAVLPHFRANKSGMLINISSIGGRMTFPLMPLYHATKFAVEGFSESLHYELKPLGVNVKVIEPGGVATDFGNRSLEFQHNEEFKEYNQFVGSTMEAFGKAFDADTISTPDVIANVIFTAATDNTETLRYRAGEDAKQLLSARDSMNDSDFIGMMKNNLGLK
ncbi:SDR family oxidoreductase [Aquimarina latercula]|uniref:SDR family oxidoreductase n=1 Tax=Aquimarina latercula TaxID=987 RepID=UPI000416AF00|nr:SDR family oxidoreductase [Aquimarina latercula]